MKCPFKTPAKYEIKITTTEYVVVDAERKVIAKCNYEDDALFLQQVINSHEKFKVACAKAYEGLCTNDLDACDEAIKLLDELKEAEKE